MTTTKSFRSALAGGAAIAPLRRRKRSLVNLLGSYTAVVGAGILLIFSLAAATAPLLPLADPEAVDVLHRLAPPSAAHLIGTDDIGRDAFSRLIYAGRISLLIGLGVSLVSVTIGMTFGALAGYFGGWVDSALMAVTNVLQSFPLVVLVMVVGSIVALDPLSLTLLISSMSWVTTARLVRGQLLSLREQPFIEAARCLGLSNRRIIVFHLIPNAIAPVLVAATLLVAFAILIESALSFIGFGVKPPTATWGSMLNAAQVYIRDAPWLGIFPGLAISLTVLSFNSIGDSLREKFDPHLHQH